MVLLKLTVQMARIKKAEILENFFAVDVKIAFPIHGILLPGDPDHRPCICLEFKLITPEFRRNLHSSSLAKLSLRTNTFRTITLNSGTAGFNRCGSAIY
jgi:hypothetical protein